ncbi:hypothetical protein [Methanosarcina sp.]|uniref:hypothetical protein n=1 Tax=Methanosarcina sp. TaxID=2213 RepID=UPI003C789F1D
MTLPEVCPLDESQTCKGRECHLFCLEWRTREPTCLIGYSTTSKIKSGKADRNKDTYAEDTFRKLGRQPISKRKNVSEKGDWTPTRLAENPPKRPVERKEASFTLSQGFQETTVRNPDPKPDREAVKNPDPKPERNHDERLRERYTANDAEKASIRLESRLKKEQAEQNPVICAKTQPKIQEKPRTPEKVISRDKHTTIFAAFDTDKKDNSYLSGKEEKAKKPPENREKRKKLDEVMEIDLPDTHDEEFWS